MINIGFWLGVIGVFYLQDALASIAFYPNEKWRWNHLARAIRGILGLILIWLGLQIIGG